MDSFDKKLRQKKVAALGLLFLLMILPLLMLREKLQDALAEGEQQRKAESAIELREEMFEFKSDLQPRFFLEKFLKNSLKPELFAKKMQKASFTDEGEQKKEAFARIFADCRRKFQAKDLSFKPLFMVLADDKAETREFDFSPKFLQARKLYLKDANDLRFLGRYLVSFAISETRGFAGVRNFLVSKFLGKFKRFAEEQIGRPEQRESTKFYFRGIISSFIKAEPQPGIVNVYFSDTFSFDNILFYTLPIIIDKRFCGVFSIAYLQSDLSASAILPSVLGMGVKSGVVRQAKWLKGSKSQDGVVQDSIQARLAVDDKSGDDLLLQVHPAAQKSSNFADYLRIVDFSAKLILAVFLLLTLRTWFFNISLSLGLRRKLLLIFSLTIFLPGLLGYLTYRETARSVEKFEKFLARSRLESRFNEIDLIYQEVFQRQVLHNLRFKLPFCEVLRQEGGFERDWDDFSHLLKNNAFSVLIYSRSGQKIALMNGTRKRKIDLIKLNNSVLAMNNLSSLETNGATRKDLQNLSYTLAFAEDVAGVFDFAQVAGFEAENTKRASNIKDSSRSQFFLLPDQSRKNFAPFAIVMMDLGPELQFGLCVRSQPGYPGRFFSSLEGDFQTDISLALRDSLTIQEEFWLEGFTRRSSGMSRLFRRAVNSRNSSGFYDDQQNRYNAWHFDEKTPVIIAGSTSYNDKGMTDFYLEFLPYVFILSLAVMLLMVAEVISRIFLSPIQTVKRAVDHIAATADAAIKVSVSSNDEFDQMGISFNLMAQGLLQKKHISRFVSQRLVQAIEDESTGVLAESSQLQYMTVLASDIRNFTVISENHPPELVVEILNEYFTLMENCIISEGGIIDKFIGDAIIAVFLTDKCVEPELMACRAAFKMKKALVDYDFKRKFKVDIENGVGIATGKAIAANLGRSFSRRDFTIVGDMVQKAELLESLTKSGKHSRIMVDDNTWLGLKGKIKATEELIFSETTCRELIEEVGNA